MGRHQHQPHLGRRAARVWRADAAGRHPGQKKSAVGLKTIDFRFAGRLH
jgi:protocatechuate 3,4-dioxygenase beta subunit